MSECGSGDRSACYLQQWQGRAGLFAPAPEWAVEVGSLGRLCPKTCCCPGALAAVTELCTLVEF